MPLPSTERDWPLLTAEEQIAIQESNQRARERLPELQRWLRNVERDVAAQRANRERELGMSIEEFLREKDNNAAVREGRSADSPQTPTQDDDTLASSKKNVHARPSSRLLLEPATSTAEPPSKKRNKQHASISLHGKLDTDEVAPPTTKKNTHPCSPPEPTSMPMREKNQNHERPE
jgi:hypothetical protein